MSDSRSPRADKVDVTVSRRGRVGGSTFIGGVAVAAVGLIVAVSLLLRGGPEALPDASVSPSGSAAAIASALPSSSPSTSPSPSAIAGPPKPDDAHGIITFENIRTEADPKGLQQPPQFARTSATTFTVAVSPDGTRVAMIRNGATGQQLVTFTTARPNDVATIVDFAGSGEVAGEIVWAGDGSDYAVFSVDKRAGNAVTYSALRSVDLAAKKQSELARVTNGLHLIPLAWAFATHLGGAVEVDTSTGRIASYSVIRDNALTDRTPLSGLFAPQISASRDGARIAAVFAPAVRWWPVDQPGASKEIIAASNGRAEYAAFRPGAEELGVSVVAATTGAVGAPGHFEIWKLSGPQRVVSPTTGFSFWRVDGTAALHGSSVIDPDTGVTTPLPGGAFKVATVVRFTRPVSNSTETPAPSPSDRVSIAGRTYRMADAYLWRDFMPVSEPGGKPLAASVHIAVDSGSFPQDVTADHLWVYGPTVWEPAQVEIRRAPEAGTPVDQIEVFGSNGPKWDPGTTVDVLVQLRAGGATFLLRLSGVTIQRTT